VNSSFPRDLCVIGGAGHVGLPLALLCADSGLRTTIYDIDTAKLQQIRDGRMPFREDGADLLLPKVLANGRLRVEGQPESMSECRFLIMVIGTPVDEHLNPSFSAIDRVLENARPHLRDGQVLVLRSTVFPGTSRRLQRRLAEWGLDIGVACCPERVAQGHSLREFREHLGGELTITLLSGLGTGVEVHEMDEAKVLQAIAWLKQRAAS